MEEGYAKELEFRLKYKTSERIWNWW